MVQLNPGASKPTKCDHCGGSPQCVAFCPTGALVVAHLPEAA
jgi:Fe-S-cluster-containing hydrogenase component 2